MSWITPEAIQSIREASDRERQRGAHHRIVVQSEAVQIHCLNQQVQSLQRELQFTQEELGRMRTEHPNEAENRPGMYI